MCLTSPDRAVSRGKLVPQGSSEHYSLSRPHCQCQSVRSTCGSRPGPMAAKVEPPTCLRRLPKAGPAHRSALTHGRGRGLGGWGGGGGHATRRHQWSTGCSLARRQQAPERVIYLIQGKSVLGPVSLGSGCCCSFVVLCLDFTHKCNVCARCSYTYTHTRARTH